MKKFYLTLAMALCFGLGVDAKTELEVNNDCSVSLMVQSKKTTTKKTTTKKTTSKKSAVKKSSSNKSTVRTPSARDNGSVSAACDQCHTTSGVRSYTINGLTAYLCSRCKSNLDAVLRQQQQMINMMR